MDMKTEYKYIIFKFVCKNVKDKKKWAECRNKKTGTLLGYVEYYKPWKQYVIEFLGDCVFNVSCLQDIIDFLSQLNIRDGLKPEKKE